MKILGILLLLAPLYAAQAAQTSDTAALVEAIRADNAPRILAELQQLRAAGATLGQEIGYFETRALEATGELEQAVTVLGRYVLAVGRDAPRYDAGVRQIASLRVRLAAAGPKAAFRAEGSEGQRVVGRIESINSNFGFVRLLLTSDEPIPHDQLYLKPDEFGSVRFSLAESRDLGKGLISATPSGDVKLLKVGQPVYRVSQ